MAFWNKRKKKKEEINDNFAIPAVSDPPQTPGFSPIYDMPAGIPIQDIPPISGKQVSPKNEWEDFISPPPHNGGWIQTYPLVFFLMENNVCTRKIEYTCYGYDRPDDILKRMMAEKLLPQRSGFAYRVLYWPTRNGMGTVAQFDFSEPKMLQDFNPEAGKVFIIEQYRSYEEQEPLYTLYGCPTAALPEQENILRDCTVDVLTFD